jgi:hypothetical protein
MMRMIAGGLRAALTTSMKTERSTQIRVYGDAAHGKLPIFAFATETA